MATLKRLFGFLRPYRRTVIWSLVFAWLAMVMTVTIPLLIGSAVDAINTGDRSVLLPLALGSSAPASCASDSPWSAG